MQRNFSINLLLYLEFALAKHLIKIKLNGDDLPAKLPDHLIPPGQRAGGF